LKKFKDFWMRGSSKKVATKDIKSCSTHTCSMHPDGQHLHHSLRSEIACHFPYAVFSVSISMIILGLLTSIPISNLTAHKLFHNFHFLHIVFSATGVILTFTRYSVSIFGGLLAGILIPAVFCTMSDSLLPYLGGTYLGIDMKFHWCFISHLDVVLPFLVIGIINGYVLSRHFGTLKIFYSKGSHFLHIFISAMASILYLVSYGFSDWGKYISFVFVYLIFAVLIPCTIADLVLPAMFAKKMKKN